MEIVLVNAVRRHLETRGNTALENAGLAYLAGSLKAAGLGFTILDNVLDGRTAAALAEELSGRDVVLAVHLMGRNWVEGLEDLLAAADRCGARVRYTVAGGQYASLYAEEILAECPRIDFLVRGEGEDILPRIAKLVEAGKTGELQRLQTKDYHQVDLATLPSPHHYSLDMTVPADIPIWASRGCAGSCAFCMIPEFYRHLGKKLRRRPTEDVLEELLELHSRTGKTRFQFGDDNFVPHGKEEQQNLSHMLEEAAVRIPGFCFSIYAKPELVQPELFRHWRHLGLDHTFLGIESFNDEFLQYLGKANRQADNLRALAVHRELELPFSMGYIMISPHFRIQDVQGELEMLENHVLASPALPPSLFHALSNCLLVYNKTRLCRKLKTEGLLDESAYDHFYDIFPYRIDPEVSIYLQAMQNYKAGITGMIGMSEARAALDTARALAEMASQHLREAQAR